MSSSEDYDRCTSSSSDTISDPDIYLMPSELSSIKPGQIVGEHLHLWLKTGHIVNGSNDDVLKGCMNNTDFVNLFGGYQNVMNVLLAQIYSDKDKLNKMHQMISTQRQINLEQKKLPNHAIKMHQKNIVSLSDIPDQCLIHITGFLGKTEIFWFKLTSRWIAILCLAEMKKVSINIATFCAHTYSLTHQNYRCHPNATLISLMKQWSVQYDINHDDVLLFHNHQHHPYRTLSTLGMRVTLMDPKLYKLAECKVFTFRMRSKAFLIADRSKFMILNGNEPRAFDPQQDTYQNLQSYRMMILQYESMQHIKAMQFIFHCKNLSYDKILKCIEQGLIFNCDDLQNSLKKMDSNQNHSKLTLFRFLDEGWYGTPRWRDIQEHLSLSDKMHHTRGFLYAVTLNQFHPDYFEDSVS